jgi:hypothetical protein
MLISTGVSVLDVDSKDFHTKAEDGHEIILRW